MTRVAQARMLRLALSPLLVLGILTLGTVSVACSGSSSGGKGEPVTSGGVESAAAAINISEAVASDSPLQFMGEQAPQQALDAHAIFAAQEQVLVDIYEKLVPSVVQVRTVRESGDMPQAPEVPRLPFDRFPDIPRMPDERFRRGGGTGFIWDEQGRIVTNHHVVAGADRVIVTLYDGSETDAEILGFDPDSDLAVLQIEIPEGVGVNPVQLGDSSALKVGQSVAAIGNPFGQDFSITSGIVSAVGRTIRSGHSQFSIPEVIQTDASMNPGNSGGPLLDRLGRVIGVNTQIISQSGANAGIGFAVPVNIAKQVVPTLIEKGEYSYAWLGISGTTLRPDVAERMDLPRDTRGTLVIDVTDGGPADKAGILGSETTASIDGIDFPLGGDVIVGIDGALIHDMDGLIAHLVSENRPDDEVMLDVIREGERTDITVTLGERPN